MKQINMIQTHDGIVHDSVQDATKYLQKQYGDNLLSIGRKLANQNYTTVTNFINDNLNLFIQLKAIKDDMKIEWSDEDE